MDQLDDILAGVHLELEDGATADRINQIANENPQLRAEILAFAAEWFASDGSDLSDDILTVQQTVSEHTILLERFWQLTMPAANGWLTIETAPKDGTWFLGWRQRQFEEDCVSVWSWYAYSPVSGLWIDADDQNDADDQPTHWQPLPKPPVRP